MSNRAYLALTSVHIIYKHVARNCKYIYICVSISGGRAFRSLTQSLFTLIASKIADHLGTDVDHR